MDAVNPALLFGALAAGVPIVLHLVMRQQPRHLEFPALRFVQVRQTANRRKLQLRHLILLLLRIAALCLLAAALARPSFKASGVIGDQEAPVAAALVIDTSPRMAYKSENQTRLEAAQETALWLLRQLPAESLLAVFDSARGHAVFQVDLGAARSRVERMETIDVPRPLWEVIEQAAELLQKGEPGREDMPQRKELYIFSDLTKPQWDARAAAPLRARLAEMTDVGVYVIDVGAKEPQNIALGEPRLSSESIARHRPWSVATEVSRTGQAGNPKVEVQVYLDAAGKSEKRGQETIELAAGQTQGVEFEIGPLETGTHQGYLRLLGADGLPADDRRWFTVDVKPPWKVLIAAAPPAQSRSMLLTEALAPTGLRQAGRARFDFEVVSFADFAQQPLEQYAAICLFDPPALAESDWQALVQYAESGGGIAILLGESFEPAAFEEAGPGRLLPGKIGPRPALYPDGDTYLTISNEQHPLMAKFRPLKGTVPWETMPIYRYWQVSKLAEGAATLATYRSGQPALVERSVGKGRVLTMTTPIEDPDAPADRRWNRLATQTGNWPYLVLMDQMFAYLAGSTEGQLNYLAGETAVLRLSAEQRLTNYLLATPRGDTLRQSTDPKQRAIIVSDTDHVGNYRLTSGGEEGGFDRGFSVNLPARASVLDRTDEEGLKEVFGDVAFQLAHDREEIDRHISTGRVGRELFPLLAMLLALVLAGEHLLANRFYGERSWRKRQPMKQRNS
jgi:hypothetical protein